MTDRASAAACVGAPFASGEGWELILGETPAALPDAEFDHVITDPPYAERTHAGARSARDIGSPMITYASATIDELRASLASLRARRWLVATMDIAHVAALEKEPPDGWRFVRFGAWAKTNPAPRFVGDMPGQGWEAIAILHRAGRGRTRWNGGGRSASWVLPTVQRSVYPAEKPLPLLLSFVDLFTDPGESVLDPYCGSGTTGVAALMRGRRFMGIDASEAALEIAAERLAACEAGATVQSFRAGQGSLFS